MNILLTVIVTELSEDAGLDETGVERKRLQDVRAYSSCLGCNYVPSVDSASQHQL